MRLSISKSKLNKSRKGQAALEFMTTYGWALMAILIAIGALSYFDFLSADKYSSSSCSTGSQIQCIESTMGTAGRFQIKLRNNYPVDIDVVEIKYKTDEGDWIIKTTPGPLIRRGDSEIIILDPPTEKDYIRGKKVNTDISIKFKRATAGANTYEILGNAVVKVV